MDRGAHSFLFLIPTAERPLAHTAQMVIFPFDVGPVWLDARKIGRGWQGKIGNALLQPHECFLDQRNIDDLQLTGLSSAAKTNIEQLFGVALTELHESATSDHRPFEQQLRREKGFDLFAGRQRSCFVVEDGRASACQHVYPVGAAVQGKSITDCDASFYFDERRGYALAALSFLFG